MKKRIGSLAIMFFGFSVFLFFGALYADDTLTISTYYPSPYGVYNEMRAKRMAIGPDYIYNSSYCWTGSCTNPQISSNTDLVVEGNVGIGTTLPGSRLAVSGGASIGSSYASTVASDGNLLISGIAGIGTASPNSSAPNGTTSGNLDANDVYLRSTSKWVSKMGGYTTFSVYTCGSNPCIAQCPSDQYLLSGGMYCQAAVEEFYGFRSYPNKTGLGGSWYCGASLAGPVTCYAHCAK